MIRMKEKCCACSWEGDPFLPERYTSNWARQWILSTVSNITHQQFSFCFVSRFPANVIRKQWRVPFQFSCMQSNSIEQRVLNAQRQKKKKKIWSNESIFVHREKQLLCRNYMKSRNWWLVGKEDRRRGRELLYEPYILNEIMMVGAFFSAITGISVKSKLKQGTAS